MAQSRLTIIGLESFLQNYGKSLFSGVTFPEGIDREQAINQIILESGEFEVLYADADFLTEAITLWSNTRQSTFSKWLEALNTSFNPLENYDRYDEYTDKEGITGSLSGGTTTSDTETTDVSAYDSSGYQPKDKVTTTGSVTNNNSTKTDRTLTHELHSHGNIGVTRASQMLSEYVDVYDKYNIYQLIAADFVPRFTIMVY